MIKTVILTIFFMFLFVIYIILSLMGVDVIGNIVGYFSFLSDAWNLLVVGGLAVIIVVALILLKGGSE